MDTQFITEPAHNKHDRDLYSNQLQTTTYTDAYHPKSAPQTQVVSIERELNREQRENQKQTHRVLHGGAPPLHGGEAEPDAAVLPIRGGLVGLRRAEVHPHLRSLLLLPVRDPGAVQAPCTAANHTGPSSANRRANTHYTRDAARLIRQQPPEPNPTQPPRIAAARQRFGG